MKMTLTFEQLKKNVHYNPDTGIFTRLISSSQSKVGSKLGNNTTKGYLVIGINRRQYYCHRLAVLYMTGEWPKNVVDHKDLDKKNNKWKNLRPATNAENLRNRSVNKNNTTGYKGISKNKDGYMVRICIGTYKTIEEASKIYEQAVKIYHGDFARLNNA